MVLTRVIHATGPSGAGTVTYTDTGGPTGLTPVAARIVATSVTALDTNVATARVSIGYYDGTNQRCVGAVSEDATATATADASCFSDSAKVVAIGNANGSTTPTLTGAAAGFGVNTLDITWDAALPNANFDIILFYGGNVRARVTSLASSASIGGTATTTGGPAMPNMVFAATTGNAFSSGGAATHGTLSEGFAGRLPSTTQSCGAVRWNSRQAVATAVANLNRNDAVCTYLSSDTAEGTRIEVSAWNSDGVEFTTRNAAASIEFAVLELYFGDSVRVWCGAPALPTSVLGAFSRTDPGFKPLALFISAVRSGAINTVGSTQGNLCNGFVVSNSQGNTATYTRDNVATSDSGVRHTQTFCGTIIQAGGTALYRFSHTSFDATGWSGDVATAGATDLNVPYVAIEDVYELNADDTENITDQHALMVGMAQSETENLTDQHAMMVGLAQSETERIADEHAFMVGLAQSETENISDEVVLISFSLSNAVLLILSEDVNVSEDEDLYLGNVLIANDTESLTDEHAMGGVMVLEETVDLLESQNFAGNILLSLSDTVNLTEASAQYLGMLLILSDTENLTEAVNFGRGLIATHGTHRGTTIQGGAEAGAVLTPHGERGTSLG